MVPNFSHFKGRLKLGMKQGLEGQTRSQRQGDFKDNCVILCSLSTFETLHIVQNGKTQLKNISSFLSEFCCRLCDLCEVALIFFFLREELLCPLPGPASSRQRSQLLCISHTWNQPHLKHSNTRCNSSQQADHLIDQWHSYTTTKPTTLVSSFWIWH